MSVSRNQGNKIGLLSDFVAVPYVFGANTILDHLNTSYYHVHGESFTYPDKAASVTLTSGSGAWNTGGSITEVIPANALSTSAFDLHWIDISSISANSEFVIDIYSGGAGSEVLIGSVPGVRNAVQSQEGSKRIQIPQQLVNTRISCKLSDSTGGTITAAVKFMGHYYA